MTDFSQYWAEKRAKWDSLRAQGKVRVWTQGQRLRVVCPISAEFALAAKPIGGRFRGRSGMWTFPLYSKTLVYALCHRCFPDKVMVVPPKAMELVDEEKEQIGGPDEYE